MAPDRRVTRENVRAAADSIKASGRRVSYRAVRQLLKGGSPNELCPLVSEWKRDQDVRKESDDQVQSIPPEVEQAFRTAVLQLLSSVQTTLEREYQLRRDANDVRVKAAESEALLSAADVEDCEKEMEALAKRLQEVELALMQERQASERLDRQLTEARSLYGVEQHRMSQARERIEELQAERRDVQGILDGQRALAAQERERAAADARELEVCRASLASAELTNATLLAKLADAEHHAHDRIAELSRESERLRRDCTLAEQEVQLVRDELNRSRAVDETLRAQLSDALGALTGGPRTAKDSSGDKRPSSRSG